MLEEVRRRLLRVPLDVHARMVCTIVHTRQQREGFVCRLTLKLIGLGARRLGPIELVVTQHPFPHRQEDC